MTFLLTLFSFNWRISTVYMHLGMPHKQLTTVTYSLIILHILYALLAWRSICRLNSVIKLMYFPDYSSALVTLVIISRSLN